VGSGAVAHHARGVVSHEPAVIDEAPDEIDVFAQSQIFVKSAGTESGSANQKGG
jgi:hypothetical protein